jgi:pSer/pThr/pTyr-binding forkhead associated (FHA) protein
VGGETQNIPAAMATDMGLARQTMTLRMGSRVQEFAQTRVVLGRGRDTDFHLEDPNVSRRHTVVYWEGGRMYVKDLGSTNGTLVNGRPVTAGPVRDGDIITIGGSEIIVKAG